MAFTRTQIGIAVGAGSLLVLVFVGYIWWLSNQGPVLARSEDHDPLTGLPVSIKMNPLRDRSTERAANKFLRELRDGHCDELLNKWEHDYHKKYAHYICKSDAGPSQPGIDQDLFTLTVVNKGSEWVVTKYDAMY
jgi:hypothetical protein